VKRPFRENRAINSKSLQETQADALMGRRKERRYARHREVEEKCPSPEVVNGSHRYQKGRSQGDDLGLKRFPLMSKMFAGTRTRLGHEEVEQSSLYRAWVHLTKRSLSNWRSLGGRGDSEVKAAQISKKHSEDGLRSEEGVPDKIEMPCKFPKSSGKNHILGS